MHQAMKERKPTITEAYVDPFEQEGNHTPEG